MGILTGPQNGRSLGVYIDNVLQAYSKSCSLSLKSATMDITSKDSALWAETLPTVKDWSVSCDGLVVLNSSNNLYKLIRLQIAGTSCVVKFSYHTTGNLYLYGTAYITQNDITANMDDPTSYTASFTGTSTLNVARMT